MRLTIEIGGAERIIDAMAVSWVKSPDYITQRVDKWLRDGSTLTEIEAAFDYVESKRVSERVDDPVALLHVRLKGSVMRSAKAVLTPSAPPVEDTHDPDARPPRMIWVRTNAPCAACELIRHGYRASQVPPTMGHTCGEMRSYVQVNRPFMQQRHEEAQREGECRLCWGAGFFWSYSAREGDLLRFASGRVATFQDQRGIRKLVACSCKRQGKAGTLR